jgi:hypothetical protein
MEELVTIEEFSTDADAKIIKEQLLKHDIESFIEETKRDETVDHVILENVGAYHFKLKVSPENSEKALGLLKNIQRAYDLLKNPVSINITNAVAIALYANHYDAILVKNQLQENGIQSFIEDSTTSSTLLGGENIGGIKLKVNSQDAEKAIELLKTLDVTYEAEEQLLFQDDEEEKKWKEDNRLQEEKNAKGGAWGFIIAGMIALTAIAWFYFKK